MPLSRITVAQLDDLGYLVDYEAATNYETSDIRSSCHCGSRRLGESRLGHHTSKRELSRSAAEMNAIEFGKRTLRQTNIERSQLPADYLV